MRHFHQVSAISSTYLYYVRVLHSQRTAAGYEQGHAKQLRHRHNQIACPWYRFECAKKSFHDVYDRGCQVRIGAKYQNIKISKYRTSTPANLLGNVLGSLYVIYLGRDNMINY